MGSVHAKSPENPPPEAMATTREKINLIGIQARVDKVHVDGLNRTKDDVIVRAVQSLFKAHDFQQVILAAHEARTLLEALGCFKNIGVFIDTSQGPDASLDGLEVTFFVRELKRMVGGVNTLVGNNEGSLVFGLRLPNLIGRGELIQAEYSYGTKNAMGFNVTASKPLIDLRNGSVTTAVYQQANEFPWSGYRLTDRGTMLDFSVESAPKVKHNLRWEGIWRELSGLDHGTAFSVREEAGHSLKSAVKHILTVDKRDSTILPNTGVLFRLQQEYAGIGGDVGFIKHEMELQANAPLPMDCVLQLSLMGGVIQHLSNSPPPRICDRFFLGGPLNLRGFSTRGVGPHTEGCAMGANTFWAGGLHLYTPLPFRPGRRGFGDLFRTHFFVNSGNIGTFQFNDYHEAMGQLLDGLRLSYGAGIVLRIGQVARFELNYCVPLKVQSGDRISPGLQFGIGISFL